jgi:hypothetical protein
MDPPWSIEMHYYKHYVPLYEVYWKATPSVRRRLLDKVNSHLNLLHSSTSKPVSKQLFVQDIFIEAIKKVRERYEDVRDCIEATPIVSVNGALLLSFEQILAYIQRKLEVLHQTLPSTYCLIHGDCQFSNVMINPGTEDLLFVDPRGYFGTTNLVGVPQYDSAKVLFALTGYDVFDKLVVESLCIENGDLTLPEIPLEEGIWASITLEVVLMLSIWLANAHCFQANPAKAVLSHSYARYLATLVYRSDRSEIK